MKTVMLNDLRLAIRSLRHRPGSTALAVAALALGIGANAAIFSFVQGIVLRPLPYPDPDRIVDLAETDRRSDGPGAVSPRDLSDFKALDTIFAGLAGFDRGGKNVSFVGSPERLSGLSVEPSYFDVLGVHPVIGRAIAPGEDTAGRDDVVVISHRIYETRFDRSPAILEKSILMDGRPYRIVGVMPHDFRAPEELSAVFQVDYFVPGVVPDDMRHNRNEHILNVIGRLRAGVSVEQANVALAEVMARIGRAEPETKREVRAFVRSGQEVLSGSFKTPMMLLLGASALIFLIASVNVASLLAARAVEESRDVAVRIALGASQGRVVRESLARSLVLAAAGCVAGLILAFALEGTLLALAPTRTPRLSEIGIDLRVVGVASLLSLVGAAVFGLLPAMLVSRSRATEALRSAPRGTVGRAGRRGRGALMAIEVGLAVLPLVGATLLVRSFVELRRVDLGFETERVLVTNLPLPAERYSTGEARFAFFEALTDRARAIPGVEAVGFANRFPLRGGWESGLNFEGDTTEANQSAPFQAIGGEYFRALGVSLLRGRIFGPSDAKGAPGTAVVNQAFVRKFLASRPDPIGQRFRRGPDRPWITVVGVVSDLRREGLTGALDPQVYLAAAQTELYPVRLADLALRVAGDPARVIKPLQTAVWSIDPEQPLANVRTLAETIDSGLAARRFQTILLILFAGLAMALALVGVYGVVSAMVAQRTQEIGLRMALGARASQVARMIVGESLIPSVLGLVAGLIGAVAMARAMSGLVFGIAAIDPMTFAVAPFALVVAVALASLNPALRAARVEPTTALRDL
jgi:predicted permease